MTDQPEHNALVAFAALTGLLAKHPELADAPVYWSYDTTVGIRITLPSEVTDLALFEQLAAALCGSSRASNAHERHGVRIEPHYLDAELAGIPVFSSAHLVVKQDGAES